MNHNEAQPLTMCPHCGYDLEGGATGDELLITCPECGSSWPLYEPQSFKQRSRFPIGWRWLLLATALPLGLGFLFEAVDPMAPTGGSRWQVVLVNFTLMLSPIYLLVLSGYAARRRSCFTDKVMFTFVVFFALVFVNSLLLVLLSGLLARLTN